MKMLQWQKPLQIRGVPGRQVGGPPAVDRLMVPTDKVKEAQLAFQKGGIEAAREVVEGPKPTTIERLRNLFRWDVGARPRAPSHMLVVPPPATWWEERIKAAQPKLHPFDSMADYQRWLERHGFEQLGKGYYGSVWGKPGHPWVIKMGNQTNDGWPVYAEFVMERHADNPFAPKIKSLRWHGGRGLLSPFYVAVVERLDHTIQYFRGSRATKLYEMTSQRFYERRGYTAKALKRLRRDAPELDRLIEDIKDKLLPSSALDLHHGNAMTDAANDRFVLTDPISQSSTRPKSKDRRRSTSRLIAA